MSVTPPLSASGTSWTVRDPAVLALRIRLRAARMVARHGLGYLGQAVSSAEQVAAVFAFARPGRDQLVCSPGHYVIGPFAAAAELGLVPEDAVATYGDDGSGFEAIGTERSPVFDYTCGSLGQGLSAAAGLALADRLHGERSSQYGQGGQYGQAGQDDRPAVFAMVSDGELEEGQVWEAAMFAAHHRLDRLTVLLDANNSQVDGPVDTITTIEPIAAKWEAFGWHAADIDGHDAAAVGAALAAASAVTDRPSVIICRTSLTRGLDLPPDADGHFIKLPPALAETVIAGLTAELRKLEAPRA
jgi:transketolase